MILQDLGRFVQVEDRAWRHGGQGMGTRRMSGDGAWERHGAWSRRGMLAWEIRAR